MKSWERAKHAFVLGTLFLVNVRTLPATNRYFTKTPEPVDSRSFVRAYTKGSSRTGIGCQLGE